MLVDVLLVYICNSSVRTLLLTDVNTRQKLKSLRIE